MAEPVRTRRSNIVYRGPTPDIGDAWAQSTPQMVYISWQLTDEERAAVAAGGLVRLGVMQKPIPPVSLDIDPDPPLGPDGIALRDRAQAILVNLAALTNPIPPGYWSVSPAIWQQLEETGALDHEVGALPTLLGRRLVEDGATPHADQLNYNPLPAAELVVPS